MGPVHGVVPGKIGQTPRGGFEDLGDPVTVNVNIEKTVDKNLSPAGTKLGSGEVFALFPQGKQFFSILHIPELHCLVEGGGEQTPPVPSGTIVKVISSPLYQRTTGSKKPLPA